MSLRPKYQLDQSEVQGSSITIPAEEYTQLTTRRFPYPRVGTRAPDSMFPKVGNPNPGVLEPKYTTDSMASPPSSGTVVAPKFIPGPITPHYMQGDGSPIVRAPALVFDWGTFFWGCVAGGVLTIAMVYGIIPALAEWGTAAIRKRY